MMMDDENVEMYRVRFTTKDPSIRESVIEIEYFEGLPRPEPQQSNNHDEWISALASASNSGYIAGSYDGKLHAYNSDGTLLAQLGAHEAPIKALARTTVNGQDIIVTGSKDQTIGFVTVYQNGNEVSLTVAGYGGGHASSVESVAISPEGSQVASGSWDNTVRLWKLDAESLSAQKPSAKENTAVRAKRSRKGSKDAASKDTSTTHQEATHVLTGHTGCVNGIDWMDNSKVISGSWDRSVCIWDAETATQVSSLRGDRAITSLSFSKANGLAITSHPDEAVRVWDPRVAGESVIKRTLLGHKEWVSQVQWAPESSTLAASSSYDGTVKLWDMRSTNALQTVSAHKDKALCISWISQTSFVSGGADMKTKVFHIPAKGSGSDEQP